MPLGVGSDFKYKYPAISELRHRVTFQQIALVSDGQGGQVQTWTDFYTCWGKFEPVSANEILIGAQLSYRRSHTLWVRHTSNISVVTATANFRVSFDSRYWAVNGVRRPDERRFFMLFDVLENSPT